jgi:diguanylate cyclase (GGDEF)-like protein
MMLVHRLPRLHRSAAATGAALPRRAVVGRPALRKRVVPAVGTPRIAGALIGLSSALGAGALLFGTSLPGDHGPRLLLDGLGLIAAGTLLFPGPYFSWWTWWGLAAGGASAVTVAAMPPAVADPMPAATAHLDWLLTALALVIAAVLVQRRVALLRRRVAEYAELALTDPLTGLPNRRAWEDELVRETARSRRFGSSFCVAILDLDRFKLYNDAHGHQDGDRLLAEAARRWNDCMRDADFIARYGGEEFAMILRDCPLADAVPALERLRAATPGGQTCSVGVARWNGGEDAAALVSRADDALYAAKESGRDCVVVHRTDQLSPQG